MKILSSTQIREVDRYTIKNEPIASIDLMERTSQTFTAWFLNKFQPKPETRILTLCGNGNNGGDGLAVSRILNDHGLTVTVYIYEYMDRSSDDFSMNLERLPSGIDQIILKEDRMPWDMDNFDYIFDALWGSGLSRPIEGMGKKIIERVNDSKAVKIAIDIPAGLHAEKNIQSVKFKADHTCTFQNPKLPFFFQQNKPYVGEWDVVDIGLNKRFIASLNCDGQTVDKEFAKSIVKGRDSFAHKNDFGHSLVIAGSTGKFGAAILTAKACLVSGSGLVTLHIPEKGMAAVHSYCPEIMLSIDEDENYIWSGPAETDNFDVICIGPGIDQQMQTQSVVKKLLQSSKKPMVLDADALNIISKNKDLLEMIPEGSILTPHPGEFRRLSHEHRDEYEALELQRQMSDKYGLYILRKGKYSCITCPDGKYYFNMSGNVALATAGSGDVLSGIISSLIAQGYNSLDSVLLGTFVHGEAADKHTKLAGTDRMIASQIIHLLPSVFGELLKE